MLEFLESIKIVDRAPVNIDLHQLRLEQTFKKFFPSHRPFQLNKIIATNSYNQEQIYKFRIVYSADKYSTDYSIYKPKQIEKFGLVEIDAFEYSYKFADRNFFQDLLSQRPDCQDLILVKNGLITDSTYANLIFSVGHNWFTPDTPLLPGTKRAQLLKAGIITKKRITLNNYKEYQYVSQINSMLPLEPNQFLKHLINDII